MELAGRAVSYGKSRLASRQFRIASRRILYYPTTFARVPGRKFLFSLTATSLLCAKCLHIYAHIKAIAPEDVVCWWLTFFTQDVFILLAVRLLLEQPHNCLNVSGFLQIVAVILATVITIIQLAVSAINIAFFAMLGSELRWRNIGLATDSASRPLFLKGTGTLILVLALLVLSARILEDVNYYLAGVALNCVKAPVVSLFRMCRCSSQRLDGSEYARVPSNDEEAHSPSEKDVTVSLAKPSNRTSRFLSTVIGMLLISQAILSVVRPIESSFTFLSWTPIIMPVVDFTRSTTLDRLFPLYNQTISRHLDEETALTDPIPLTWLPKLDDPLLGFEDWYPSKHDHYDHYDHYNATADPLNMPNFKDDLISPLRGQLDDVNIRHVMLIMLESTRKDVFPIKKDSFIWKQLAESWDNKTIPPKAEERIATLTPNANFITGDYADGFEHETKPVRGGINFNNNHPTGTYTLKSITGTLCGLTPLVVDQNLDYLNHYYQPCLPHIFKAFNSLEPSVGDGKNKWMNWFMMSVMGYFDRQDAMMSSIGYVYEEYVTKEYLQSEGATFGPTKVQQLGNDLPEVAIKDYLVNAFKTAKENDTRVFLTHLTSTAHWPYRMPDDEEYVPLVQEGKADSKLDLLSRYVNAVGYVDRWLGKILNILEDQGVINETLIVLVGDHGLSLPETGAASPYGVPNIGNFHVPLVFSHPHLPQIDVNTPVNSISILPTIIDLLIETGSLSMSEEQAARELLPNYEGLSLLRPLEKPSDDITHWQFTVLSPGGSQVAIRSVRNPQWRLILPVIEDIEWWFTNVDTDPHELDAVQAFDFTKFLKTIEETHGIEAARWAEEAAFVTRWYILDNAKRWRYKP
ncbi:sulfatase domain-containing protein [Pochonia chlamydosporia 170]|uniref:Sulfatase domain-containing protein n=1 Tax=Pochonia chlamydosporia 170 TaxID=1380566 RepID=A0A179F193_METCM|nr:sulfatase domain-containing protein [Pochonia chlamydosporia 170]OAQ59172.1 sulfatase domain-containing protein [Pochonia chlamydosporia 170]